MINDLMKYASGIVVLEKQEKENRHLDAIQGWLKENAGELPQH